MWPKSQAVWQGGNPRICRSKAPKQAREAIQPKGCCVINLRGRSRSSLGYSVAAGDADLAFSLPDARQQPFLYDPLWPIGLGMVGVVCGFLLLRGNKWSRGLCVAWLAFHVIGGSLDSVQKLVVHGLLLAVIAYFLFRRRVNAYFRSAAT